MEDASRPSLSPGGTMWLKVHNGCVRGDVSFLRKQESRKKQLDPHFRGNDIQGGPLSPLPRRERVRVRGTRLGAVVSLLANLGRLNLWFTHSRAKGPHSQGATPHPASALPPPASPTKRRGDKRTGRPLFWGVVSPNRNVLQKPIRKAMFFCLLLCPAGLLPDRRQSKAPLRWW